MFRRSQGLPCPSAWAPILTQCTAIIVVQLSLATVPASPKKALS